MSNKLPFSFASVDDEEAKCCWCGGPFEYEHAPLVIPALKIAWCKNSEECRERQRAWSMAREIDGVEQWLFVPTPKGVEVCEAEEKNVLVMGNRGGGKSHNIRWFCHMMSIVCPGFKYAILRTSFPELMKNHLNFLEDEAKNLGGEKEGVRYNKTDHIFYYGNGSIGYYAQCATDADVNKILGAEVALVVFDEAPTFQWDHMQLIAASIRVPKGSGLVPMTRYLGNPMGESIDEIDNFFINKDVDLVKYPDYRPQDWRHIPMNIQDNPFLDRKEYWAQFSTLPPHVQRAWRDGIRVEEDTLFEFFPSVEGKPYHVIHEIPRFSDGTPLFTVDRDGVYHFPDWVRIYRSYDHGFKPDPAVMLWFAVYGKRILCFKEMTWNRTLAVDIAKETIRESKGMRVSDTFCDPTIDITTGADVKTIKQKMESAGVPMTCSINRREMFADAVHAGLNEQISPDVPVLQFLAPGKRGTGCPMTIKWLPRMKIDPNDPKKMAEHKYDHWIVALAYFLMSQIPVTKPSKTTSIRPWQVPKKPIRGSSYARILQKRMQRRYR